MTDTVGHERFTIRLLTWNDTLNISTVVYRYQSTDQIKSLNKSLQKNFHLSQQEKTEFKRCWFDTFDWRLLDNNLVLTADDVSAEKLITLTGLNSGNMITRQSMHQVPGFISGLGFSPLKLRLQPVVEPRRLMQRMCLVCHSKSWVLLNQDQKIILRVVSELFTRTNDDKTVLMAVLMVRPLRGYESFASPVIDWLDQQKSLKPYSVQKLTRSALTIDGQAIQDYSSAFNVKLSKTQSTDSALRQILLSLFETLQKNVPGTIDDTDSEFLHDLRVAVRRSRSALSRIKKVFPPSEIQRFEDDLRWLATITSQCRDLDVYLLAMDNFKSTLPDAMRSHLDPFKLHLQDKKVKEQKILSAHLQSERMKQFLHDWKHFLKQTVNEKKLKGKSAKPVSSIAGAATWKMYQRVIDNGGQLNASSPAEKFHNLRKDGKKLRYLMELFASLYPEKRWKKLLKTQKKLQNILGDFQDLEVQSDYLQAIGREMFDDKGCSADTLMALGTLSTYLREQQSHALDHFSELFKELANQSTYAEFYDLCMLVPQERKQ